MIAFSSLATSQLEKMHDGLNTVSSKIGWVNTAKNKISAAVLSGNYTVMLIPGLTVSCNVTKGDTELTVKEISQV
ncbi:hypothetical protein [Psychrobacter sp. ANT_WB68]|uniref:hypothetical protein n=1 Tax=Psychrobacter sp. ANT_WB68 TaxID=2597355 RepID=UPI0011F190A2|nr:hypothetical protein [Psychrobacter sp. ANT_WB68]KAA0915799.1 hypothetical protein FQ084_04500 [Psychrobacter sp. ANT_WB68]